MKYDKRRDAPRKCRETRALLGSRFKILLADAGLSPEAAGELLHVTPRTIRYWLSGKVSVPYAAYRLVRVMRLFELPCIGWEGWHMHSGKLWSPEGFGFLPADSEWWNGLIRKARLFHQLYERDRQLDIALQRMKGGNGVSAALGEREAAPGGGGAPSPTGEAGRAAKPTGPNLLIVHLKKKIGNGGVNSPIDITKGNI